MPLKLMYITNNPAVAKIAEDAGVDRIFVDMEYVGKAERQRGDTVKNAHTIEDVRSVRASLSRAELLVRCNPIDCASTAFDSEREINAIADAGADIIMLPMAKDADTVRRFVKLVGGRMKAVCLLERRELVERIDEILQIDGIDEIHVGLNDLHLSYGQRFMFEPLADGTVEYLAGKFTERGIPFGFGGIARIGKGLLPSELVIAEHYRLGSEMAILSRSFCNAAHLTDLKEIAALFTAGVAGIRAREAEIAGYTAERLEQNRIAVKEKIEAIAEATAKA